ncbi:MAG TPA: aldo/keto reductase [Verrucomicrobiae bacterium]|nr:aldo/keto reductase [Verrucomicrobiae bacterium]
MRSAINPLAGVFPANAGRRKFLQTVGAFGLGAALNATAAAEKTEGDGSAVSVSSNADEVPRRSLGRAGVQISALGCGGHHLGDIKKPDEAIELIHRALDAGITFFDNCWEYYNGETENILGRGLKGRRDQIFLMTKVCTHGRSAELALRMLEQSLRRLQTDHLDLWQIHAISFDNDPELAYAKDGVIEALDKAKQQGKTRFVGFTGHKNPAFHLEMLKRGFPFDTVQMPLNAFDATFHSFEQQVLPEVNRRGMAALGMKSMGGTADAVKKGVVKAEELLRYAMSLPVATTISGMDSLKVLEQNLRVARGFKPMTPEEMDALRQRCAPMAADGRFEPYTRLR